MSTTAQGAAMRSHVVPCSSAFRDAILAAARAREATPSDLARAVLLLVDAATLAGWPDPGEPDRDDRELVSVRSGTHAGRTVVRKPRLQVRLPAGLAPTDIRRALALALALGSGERRLDVRPVRSPSEATVQARQAADLAALGDLMALALPHLPGGVRTEADARYMLSLPPDDPLDPAAVKARFKRLAQLYHPDRPWGNAHRMAQLLDARRLLERRLAGGA